MPCKLIHLGGWIACIHCVHKPSAASWVHQLWSIWQPFWVALCEYWHARHPSPSFEGGLEWMLSVSCMAYERSRSAMTGKCLEFWSGLKTPASIICPPRPERAICREENPRGASQSTALSRLMPRVLRRPRCDRRDAVVFEKHRHPSMYFVKGQGEVDCFLQEIKGTERPFKHNPFSTRSLHSHSALQDKACK